MNNDAFNKIKKNTPELAAGLSGQSHQTVIRQILKFLIQKFTRVYLRIYTHNIFL